MEKLAAVFQARQLLLSLSLFLAKENSKRKTEWEKRTTRKKKKKVDKWKRKS